MIRVIAGRTYGIGGVGWPARRVEVEEPLAIREQKLIDKLKEWAYGGVHAKAPSGHYENVAFYAPPRSHGWVNINKALEKIRYADRPILSMDELSIMVKKVTEFYHYDFEPIDAFAFWIPVTVNNKKDILMVGLSIPEDMIPEVARMVDRNTNFVFKVYQQLFPAMAAKTKFRFDSKRALLDLGRSGTVDDMPVDVIESVDYAPPEELIS